MKNTLATGVSLCFAALLSTVTANAFTLTGKVSDEGGKAVEKASVSLLGKGISAETDVSGAFTLHQDEAVPGAPGTVTPGAPGDSGQVPGVGQDLGGALVPGEVGGIDGLAASRSVGFLSVNGGVLSFSQSSGVPVRVQVFDMVGNFSSIVELLSALEALELVV